MQTKPIFDIRSIERFWKFTKSKLRTKYYTDFKEFADKIDTITASSDCEFKKDIDKFITEKVQLFDTPSGGYQKVAPLSSVQHSVGLAA